MSTKNLAIVGGALLALGVAVSPAHAVEDRFDYMEVRGTGTGEIDGPDGTTDIESGVSLEAAKSIDDMFFLRGTADLHNLEAPAGGDESGLDFFSVGPGIGVPLEWAHLWGQVNYERLNLGDSTGTGPGVEVGATVGPADGLRLGLSARHGQPDFEASDEIEYDLYQAKGFIPVSDTSDIVLSYQEGTLETPGGDTDLNEVVSLGVRLGF